MMKTYQGSLEQDLRPVWDTDIVYNESILMLAENGPAAAPLLYDPVQILSVRNAALTEEYEEGRDWVFQDGRLVLTENTRIFYFTTEQLYPAEARQGGTFSKTGGGNILFAEGHFFHDCQIAVTYTCQKGQWRGPVPAFAGEALPETMRLLTKEKALSLTLFGDSISTGANASGVMGAPPYLPSFGALLAENLRRYYGAEIAFSNPSVGGTDSFWGAEKADTLVCPHKPDLAIIAFGMNDHVPGPAFAANIEKIMETVRVANPKAEFILVATSLPNELAKGFTTRQYEYKDALEDICGKGVALCNIRDMQLALMTRKRFIDLTGNHVNHPNDFFGRIHAQTLSALLLQK